jgi:hypothetical protein
MTAPAEFGHQAAEPGERTNRTLADILGIDADDLASELRSRMEQIGEAERPPEPSTAEVRLY